jgi:hypothetical protein
MLPRPPGAMQSALRLWKSILQCGWKHPQLWRCIQDALRLDLEDSQILEQRRLREKRATLVQLCARLSAVFSQRWLLGFHNHNVFVYQIHLCLSYKIHYIFWHVLPIKVSLYIYIQRMWLQTVLECSRWSTCRLWLRELTDAFGGHDRVNWEIYLVAAMKWVWRCTWRPRSSWTPKCTEKPWSSEAREALGGGDCLTPRCTWMPW